MFAVQMRAAFNAPWSESHLSSSVSCQLLYTVAAVCQHIYLQSENGDVLFNTYQTY